MSRNGAGIYSLPVYGNPVVNGTVIDPVWANGNFSDMATALTTSISSDGQTPITGNLMMSGFKHTGAGAASATGQYVVWGQTIGYDLNTTANIFLSGAQPIVALARTSVSSGQIAFNFVTTGGGTWQLLQQTSSSDLNFYSTVLGDYALSMTQGGLITVKALSVVAATPSVAIARTSLGGGQNALNFTTPSQGSWQIYQPMSSTDLRIFSSVFGSDVLTITQAGLATFGGVLKVTGQPCVQANRSTSDTYTTNTYTKVAFDAKTIDVASNFTTGTFTAPVAGTYQVSFNGYMDSVTTSGELGVRLYKNGTTVGVVFETHVVSSGTAAYSAFSRTGFITLAASDTVELYMAKINGANVNAYQTTIAIRLMQ